MIWYDTALIWYDMIWYDLILYDLIWCDTILIWHDYDLIWYDMIWYVCMYVCVYIYIYIYVVNVNTTICKYHRVWALGVLSFLKQKQWVGWYTQYTMTICDSCGVTQQMKYILIHSGHVSAECGFFSQRSRIEWYIDMKNPTNKSVPFISLGYLLTKNLQQMHILQLICWVVNLNK